MKLKFDDTGGGVSPGMKIPVTVECEWDGDAFCVYVDTTMPRNKWEDSLVPDYTAAATAILYDEETDMVTVTMHFQLTELQAGQVHEMWGKVLAQ